MSDKNLIEIQNLTISYKNSGTTFFAVKNVSFNLGKGETLALVGESGCGKSSIAKAIVGINTVTSGTISYSGNKIHNRRKTPLSVRKDIQMIFQDPYSSLNPRMTIETIIKEPLRIYKTEDVKKYDSLVDEILESVCLPNHYKYRYPHELSGGERQRVSIARALVSKPKVLICDEPTHALDVSVQASIINLLLDLKEKYNLSILFISHDLCLVKYVANTCLVMYKGEIVERGPSPEIFLSPLHPFTKKLISSVPIFNQSLTREESTPSYKEREPALAANSPSDPLMISVNELKASLFQMKLVKQKPKSSDSNLCPYLNKCSSKRICCEKETITEQQVNNQRVRCLLFNKD